MFAIERIVNKKCLKKNNLNENIPVLYKQYTEMKVFCFDIISVSLETMSFIFIFSWFWLNFLTKERIVLDISFLLINEKIP